MPNKAYLKGRKKEYKLVNELRGRGFDVIRSAGSHGFADVVGVHRDDKKILFIQSKGDNIRKGEYKRLMEENKDIKGKFLVEFIVA